MNTDGFKRKLSAILSADVAGYSRLMGDDEEFTIHTLTGHREMMSTLIKQHQGRVVDSPGDNLLAEFESVTRAVDCAVEIQREMAERNEELPDDRKMEYRIGVNLGDVIEEGDRIYGDGVNIAARLESLAEPGGICISGFVYNQVKNRLKLEYEFMGDQSVKNIKEPVPVYRVLSFPGAAAHRVIRAKETAEKSWRNRIIIAVAAVVVICAALAIWSFYPRGPAIEPASIERMAYPLPDRPSIAVLPFTNMSGDPEQDYIGDGLSENIISALSVSSQMFVMSRSATFTYKGKPVKPQQVAEELGIQYVLEGSIQKSEDRLRVTAQLIDALSGHHLWTEVYDREMKELFELQDEITKKIAVSVGMELGGGEAFRVISESTDNLEAWIRFNKGGQLFFKFNKEDNAKAREYFETAIRLDPEYVAAMSMVAGTHVIDCASGWSNNPNDSMNRALELSQKAVALDEQNPTGHGVLGQVFLYQRQYEKAIAEGKRAIALSPNHAHAHVLLADAMRYSGRFHEAINHVKKAYRLNPNIPRRTYVDSLATSYIFLKRYEEALEICKQMGENINKGITLSWIYQELGREEEARAHMAKALEITPDLSLESIKKSSPYKNPAHLQRMLDAYRKAGMPEKAPGAVQEKPSIAVLPFDDLSPEKDQEYFVLGLSEEILNSLAQIPDLTVKARTSSFSFKGQNKTIQEIAKILSVDHILEGSVRKAGNTIRITAQLIKTDDESHLWSETYDRELQVKEMFAVQEDIATSVADELKLELGVGPLKQLGRTDNLDAYELYLVAKGQLSDFIDFGQTSSDLSVYLSRIQKSLDAAIALDPEFALAWALKALNQAYHIIFISGYHVDSMQAPVLNAALRAIELEPNLAEAYYSLGMSRLFRGEFIKAELAYRKAMELSYSPENFVLFWIELHFLAVGYSERANEMIEAARQNDPLNHINNAVHIFSSGLLGGVPRADEKYDHFRPLFGDHWIWGDHFITLIRLGAKDVVHQDDIMVSDDIHDAAKEHLESPKEGLAKLHQIYRDDNRLSESELTNISLWAAYFGDPEFAMDAMEKGIKISSAGLFKIWLPVMREVRQLPRFKELMKEIGLVEYWKEYGWPDLCRPVGDDDFVCD